MLRSDLSEMYSVVSYLGTGALKEFNVPFPYLYREDIHVYFINIDEDGNEVRTELRVYPLIQTNLPPSSFDVYWLSDSIIKFVNAPADGQEIEIRRLTNRFEPEVVFANSAILTEDDLNLIATQLLYVVQEAYDSQSLTKMLLEEFTVDKVDVAVEASNRAIAAADAAEADRVEVAETKEGAIELLTSTSATEASNIIVLGSETQNTIMEEGNYQLERLEGFADVGGLEMGLACACQTWQLEEDIPAGSTIVLPNELRYVPNRNHLWLSYGGMVLSPSFFTEVGDMSSTSREFIINTNLKAGQELMAWVIPLGKAYEVELTDRIKTLEDAFAELSRTVVYATEAGNDNTE